MASKRTYGKVLEAENVKDVDRRGAFSLVDDAIDPIDQPSEERAGRVRH